MASSEDNSIKNETREEGDGEVRINSGRNILLLKCTETVVYIIVIIHGNFLIIGFSYHHS